VLLTAFAFSAAPWLFEWFRSLIESERRYIVIPPPFTEDLYFYILLNNVGHLWNPLKMLVWVPLFGTFVLGLEILLNGALIGALSVTFGMAHGALYPIKGLMPHGVLEIPAFILQFASIIRWHVASIEVVTAKIAGKRIDGAKFKRDVKDTVILAIASTILFSVAAYVETFITPSLLEK